MNRNLKKIIVVTLALGIPSLPLSIPNLSLTAETTRYTNKTFLATRSLSVNLALENSDGWHTFAHYTVTNPNAFGYKTQSSSFYQATTNEIGLGKYFGIKQKNVILVATGNDVATTPNVDFDLGLIVHNQGASTGTATNPSAAAPANQATIKFRPLQQAVGFTYTIDYGLNKILKNLFVRAQLPLVRVETSMELFVSGAQQTVVQSFLSGNLPDPANNSVGAANAQAPLQNGLINGRDVAIGFADIDLMLGYNIPFNPVGHASLNIGVTIPTGNKVTGKNAFEAICGNGRHFGIGGSLDCCFNLYENKYHKLALQTSANYRYLLEAPEQRILGITGQNFGQYTLLLDRTKDNDMQQLTPAANVLTQKVTVLPGSLVDAIFALLYNYYSFCFDLGYNLYYHETETVSRRENFNDTKYAIASTTADMSQPRKDDPLDKIPNGNLTLDKLNTGTATTPEQVTNKVYGGIGYIFKNWDMPVLIGIGGHYEFAARNNALETWQINGKLGFSF